MSLYTLATDYVARRHPGGLEAAPVPPAAPQRDSFESLTKYIPVETITRFVAAMAAHGALKNAVPWLGPWVIYGVCGLLTPVIVWRLAARAFKRSEATGSLAMPWWPMIAATIAFLIWSLSVPPLLDDNGRLAAGVGALFISTLLSLFEP